MLPREHGAVAQLLFPLITALAIGRPTRTAVAIVAAAVLLFVAHEPLLVLLGQRGARAARERGRKATYWLLASTIGAVVAGGVAFQTIAPSLRSAFAIPVALGAVVAGLIVGRHEHSLVGEMVSAIALASLAYPVALASGATALAARTCAIVFAFGFGIATVCVRAVIANARFPPALGARGAGLIAALVAMYVLVSLAERHVAARIAPWAALPLISGGGALVIAPPPARQLRVVGWTLVGTSAVTSLVATVALR